VNRLPLYVFYFCILIIKAFMVSVTLKPFHVGHFIPAKEVDPRRFMLVNLRIQCYSCNAMNSGRRAEYRINLIQEMGLDHVEWLECDANHKSLNDQYTEIEDIKREAVHYRRLSKI